MPSSRSIRTGAARRLVLFAASLAFGAVPGTALAWHPHPEITRAAIEALDPNDAILRQLGVETKDLGPNSLMPDWRRQLRKDKFVWFYTDDYLLFPGSPMHHDHMSPYVKETYEPFFRRALQALRTETAPNAGRWIGSVIHFAEDTGAPPHAAGIRGDLHGKMENWAGPERLHIPGYRPQLLGGTDNEAVDGLRERMEALTEFSRQRAERVGAFVASGDRAKADPILIESAEESSRAVADLLFTLGELAAKVPPGNDAALRGTISSRPCAGLERMPAKVMLLGTAYSTLADDEGRYVFRNLPPGGHTLAVMRPGSVVATQTVTLSAGAETVKDVALAFDKSGWNMVRNAAMSLRWLTPDRPDGWYPGRSRSEPAEKCWEGELLPLHPGSKYRLDFEWQDGASGKVRLRILGPPGSKAPPTELRPTAADATTIDFTATRETTGAQVLILGEKSPAAICKHAAFRQVDVAYKSGMADGAATEEADPGKR